MLLLSLIGVSIAEEKPSIEIFLGPIVNELKRLEYGVKLSENSEVKCFLLAGIFDKPAKAKVLNMKSYNGFYGCTKCVQPGKSFRADETKKGGVMHIYPYRPENPKGPLRTDQGYAEQVRRVRETGLEQNGVFGPCCLAFLKHYKPISSTYIDYMHTLLEGVVKSLFKNWFESERTAPFSLKPHMQEVDKKLLHIKPPRFIPSAPRTIYTYHLWKAHEYLAFLLFYALPVLSGLLQDKYLDNLIKLVIFSEEILSSNIKVTDLERTEEVIFKFVQEAETLYPQNFMTSGVHELLHMTDCVRDFVSLNAVNCFPFEELNRKLCRLFHAKDLIGEELVNNYCTLQALSSYTAQSQNQRLNEFICKKLNIKTSNSKQHKETRSLKVGKARTTNNSEYIASYNSLHNESVNSLLVSDKVTLDNIVFSSSRPIKLRKETTPAFKHQMASA